MISPTMLQPLNKPAMFVTGTDTNVGKTVVTGAIGQWFRRRGTRVGVCKPMATGCERRREGLVSEDAEFLAVTCDSPHPLDLICPQRFSEPLAPAVAAQRARVEIEWPSIQASLTTIERDSELTLVEGAGGILVPIDESHTMLDMARWLGAPVLVVARAGLGTINHTLLTIAALNAARVRVLGVVINRYPAESPDVASETNPGMIERYTGVPVLAIVPEARIASASIPADIAAAIDTCDWAGLLGVRTGHLPTDNPDGGRRRLG